MRLAISMEQLFQLTGVGQLGKRIKKETKQFINYFGYYMKKYFGNRFRNYTLKKNPKIFRPTSSPFISGDTLRNEVILYLTKPKHLIPHWSKIMILFFWKTDLKEIYFQSQHPKISNRYILISIITQIKQLILWQRIHRWKLYIGLVKIYHSRATKYFHQYQ